MKILVSSIILISNAIKHPLTSITDTQSTTRRQIPIPRTPNIQHEKIKLITQEILTSKAEYKEPNKPKKHYHMERKRLENRGRRRRSGGLLLEIVAASFLENSLYNFIVHFGDTQKKNWSRNFNPPIQALLHLTYLSSLLGLLACFCL